MRPPYSSLLLLLATTLSLLIPVPALAIDLETTYAVSEVTAEIAMTGLDTPRGMTYDPISNTIIVVARGPTTAAIVSLAVPDPATATPGKSGFPLAGWTPILNISQNAGVYTGGLTHGIALSTDSRWIYMSTPARVYRWPFNGASRLDPARVQLVVDAIPITGHNTRTLLINPTSTKLFVNLGSLANVDSDNTNALIRVFDLTRFPNDPAPATAPTPYLWTEGAIAADGLRNSVGFTFDPLYGDGETRIWEVNNGPEFTETFPADVYGTDSVQGVLIADVNPAEEMNMVDLKQPKRSYGYPYCFTEGLLPPAFSDGSLSQHTWPGQSYSETYDCMNTTLNTPPALVFPGHVAPMDIKFYSRCANTSQSFPCGWVGDAFVSFHGSFRRSVPDGYGINHVPFYPSTRMPTTAQVPLFGSISPSTNCLVGNMNNCARANGMTFDRYGRLWVSLSATRDVAVVRGVMPGEQLGGDGKPVVYRSGLTTPPTPVSTGGSPNSTGTSPRKSPTPGIGGTSVGGTSGATSVHTSIAGAMAALVAVVVAMVL